MPAVPETNNQTPSHSTVSLRHQKTETHYCNLPQVTHGGSDSGSLVSGVSCECFCALLPPLYQGSLVQWNHKEAVNYSECSSINYRDSRLGEQG